MDFMYYMSDGIIVFVFRFDMSWMIGTGGKVELVWCCRESLERF